MIKCVIIGGKGGGYVIRNLEFPGRIVLTEYFAVAMSLRKFIVLTFIFVFWDILSAGVLNSGI